MNESSASSRLNDICDAFEKAWKAGTAPEIESVLQAHPAIDRELLLQELIAIEAFRRAQRGERIEASEYGRRFPEIAHQLPNLLRDARRVAVASEATVATHIATADERTVAKPSAAKTGGEFPHASPAAGQQLGHYRLVKQLGAGGMGTVWEAIHTRLEKTVALKLLSPQLLADAGLVARFDREMKAVGKLEHSHLVRAYDAGEDRGVHYLAMEYIDGMDLARYVRERGPLSVPQALHVLIQASEGLAEAHRAQMIHRDIKPANLMLTRKGVVKITDLGLARLQGAGAAQHDGTLTAAGQILGTPDFMAPEQWDDTHTVDGRCDLYALGCTLFFLLTGSVPYRTQSSLMQKMRAHLTQPMPDLVAERQASLLKNRDKSDSALPTLPATGHDLPEALVAVYQRLVAKNPADRFATAEALTTALRAISPSAPGASPTVLPVTRPTISIITDPELQSSVPARPHRLGTGMLATTIILLAAVVGLGVFSGVRSSQSNPNAKSKTTKPTPTSPTGWQGWPADAPQPAIAPFDAAQAKKHQEEWAAYLKVPVEYTNSVGMKFRLIPPGEFLMGSPQAEIDELLKSAVPSVVEDVTSQGPQHKVVLIKPIYAGVTEVTQTQYKMVMGTNPSFYSPTGGGSEAVVDLETGKLPVEWLSWNDAADFSFRLSQQEKFKAHYYRTGETVVPLEGQGYRLPTEAEWEFMCRGGTTTRFWFGNEPRDSIRFGWIGENSGNRTHVVGELPSNPFGLCDLLGNVAEFVEDAWDPDSYGRFAKKSATNPIAPITIESSRGVRGRNDFSYNVGSAVRSHVEPHSRFHGGIRLALEIDAVRTALKVVGPAIPAKGEGSNSTASEMADGSGPFESLQGKGWQNWPAHAPKPAIAPFDTAQAKKHQQEWAVYLKVPVEYTNSIGMKFRLIPPGEFLMGSTPQEIEEALPTDDREVVKTQLLSESPQHRVILMKPFYLGVFEVNQREFVEVMGNNPSYFASSGTAKDVVEKNGLTNTENFPAENMPWNDAAEFTSKLSLRERMKPSYTGSGNVKFPLQSDGYRLPTEAEWEYACRAGTKTAYWFGDRAGDISRFGWVSTNADGHVNPVGQLEANPFGLYDIVGNVTEWTQDSWDPDYYRQFVNTPAIDPQGASGSMFRFAEGGSAADTRIHRGGNFYMPTNWGRSGRRAPELITNVYGSLGFRTALSVDAVKAALADRSTDMISERTIAEWILSIGGSLRIIHDGRTIPLAFGDKLPDPPFVIDWVDLRKLGNRSKKNTVVLDDNLVRVSGLKALRELLLLENPITDRGIAQLRDLPKLRLIHLQSTEVTDAVVDTLLEMPTLEHLYLGGTKVTPAILPKLKSLPNLKLLSLYHLPYEPMTGASLLDLPMLREVDLNESWLTDTAIALFKPKQLTGFSLKIESQVRDEQMQLLASLPQLERFNVTQIASKSPSGISSGGFRALRNLPRLTSLDITNLPLDDEHLKAIAEIKGLEGLYIAHYGMTSSSITDTGLEQVSHLPNLKELTLMKTQVTSAGLARFRMNCPRCRVTTD